MGYDPLSPVTPARLKILLLPCGRIKRSRYSSFVARLRPHNVVRLGDVSPDKKENRNMFSPLAFPSGTIIFDLCTSLPPTNFQHLFPFELFRDPLAIVGIADARELAAQVNAAGLDDDGIPEEEDGLSANLLQPLHKQLEDLKDQFPKALVHQVFLFDYDMLDERVPAREGLMLVPSPKGSTTTSVKTVMCDLASVLLAEMSSFAKGIQGLATIESPKEFLLSQRRATNGFASPFRRQSLSRKNSYAIQEEQQSQTDSESSIAERIRQRMSMPVHFPTGSRSTSRKRALSRPISPLSGKETPPSTFSEISETMSGVSLENIVTRSSAGAASRSASRDRKSIQGFGPGSLNERARTKGKGRISAVIGGLYLLAGRWSDAVKELVESLIAAKVNNDNLWHAKVLENLLVALLMLGWAGIDFHVPQVLYQTNEKSSSRSSPVGSIADLNSGRPSTANRLISLQALTKILPELVETIFSLYDRAKMVSGEALPQLAHSEIILRLSRLLASIQRYSGTIDDGVLQHIVTGVPLPPEDGPALSLSASLPSRSEIAAMVFRAYPQTGETEINISDNVMILSGMASILSDLGFQRKKALIIRELIGVLIPGLVQARKVGAAELGVHPAAGLVTSGSVARDSGNPALDIDQSDENGIKDLLELLGEVYGTVRCPTPPSVDGSTANSSHSRMSGDSTEEIIERILRNRRLWYFGNLNLKVDILKSCINLCEALPDLQGVLEFTVDLLQTAAGAILQASPLDASSKLLRPEDQIRLLTNLRRTVGASPQLGIHDLQAEFWDEFIVRDVQIQELVSPKRLLAHEKRDLDLVTALDEGPDENPFIHNPFLRVREIESGPVLVEGEGSDFRVTLRNLLDFEIEIERLSLESQGVELETVSGIIKVGPRRRQTAVVTATPKGSGMVIITGCIIKVRDCRERRFAIFTETWKFRPDSKLKCTGLAASKPLIPRPLSSSSNNRERKVSISQKAPVPNSLDLKVIGAQPIILVESTSLPHTSLMLLEGENVTFDVILRNISPKTAVDFILVTFQNSLSKQLESALTDKDLLPSEIYELEWQLYMKQCLNWNQREEDSHSILPGQRSKLQINVFGKAGLSSAVIQIDYGRLGKHKSQVQETFYTRHVDVPITVTVNASVELVRTDVLPLNGSFAWQYQQSLVKGNDTDDEIVKATASRNDVDGLEPLLSRIKFSIPGSDHCFLLIDLRNAWPTPLSVSMQVADDLPSTTSAQSRSVRNSSPISTTDPWKDAFIAHDRLQPGHTSRLVLPLPRLSVKCPHAPIPSLNPNLKRQFVISDVNKTSPAAERAAREAFWFREEALKHIRGTWTEDSTGRTGEIDLRGLRLTTRMVEVIRLDDIELSLSVSPSSQHVQPICQTGPSTYTIQPDNFYLLTATIHNYSSTTHHLIVRLLPSLPNQPNPVALDLARRFAFTGALQQALPILPPGGETRIQLGICALCRGDFEIGALAEEIRTLKVEGEEEAAGVGMFGGVGDELVKLGRERKGWVAREPCIIKAREDGIL